MSGIAGKIVVTALGDPPRDLGSFAAASNAAGIIVADLAGRDAVVYGSRLARDFLAPLEERRVATSVTIRRTRLESRLAALDVSCRRVGNVRPRPA